MAEQLIHDWNTHDGDHSDRYQSCQLVDETIRDGLQGCNVQNPSILDKQEALDYMRRLGINGVALGFPANGDDSFELAKYVAEQRLGLRPYCLARAVESDIEAIDKILQATGLEIDVMLFIGSSPVRMTVEGWDVDSLREAVIRTTRYAVSHNLPVIFASEDATRTRPEDLQALYTAAIENGARRIALTDTVGHITPVGVRSLLRFIVNRVIRPFGEQIGIDWHGHKDRDLAVANSLVAIEEGADRVHGTALGIGERVGNTPLEALLMNLHLFGNRKFNLADLQQYCEFVARVCGIEIPANLPIVGSDAFKTGTGIHGAAVVKALGQGYEDLVYAGVPANILGRHQEIVIGPMSGKTNVAYVLRDMRLLDSEIEPPEGLCEAVLQQAKTNRRILTSEEITNIARRFGLTARS